MMGSVRAPSLRVTILPSGWLWNLTTSATVPTRAHAPRCALNMTIPTCATEQGSGIARCIVTEGADHTFLFPSQAWLNMAR